MFSKSSNSRKNGRVKFAVVFAVLALVVLAGVVLAQGPMRPPGPPMNDSWGMKGWGGPHKGWYPTVPGPEIEILDVVEDQCVIFKTSNLPEDMDFDVTLGPIYSRGVDGTQVGSFNSSDDVDERIYRIPPDVEGDYRIALRIETEDDHPYFAFNWFYNSSTTDECATDTVNSESTEEATESESAEAEATDEESSETEATEAESTEDEVTETEESEGESSEGQVGTGGADAEETDESEAEESEESEAETSEESEAEESEESEAEESEESEAETSEEAADAEASEEASQELVAQVDYVVNGEVPSFEVCAVRKDMEVHIETSNFPDGEVFKVLMGIMPNYPEMDPYYDGKMKRPKGYDGYGQSMNDKQGYGYNMAGPNNGQYGQPMNSKQGYGYNAAGPNNGQYGQPMYDYSKQQHPMPMPEGKYKSKMPPKVWIAYYEAGEYESGDQNGGLAMFEIPEELAGAYRISILLRTDDAYPYYAYNWFYNNSAVVCEPD